MKLNTFIAQRKALETASPLEKLQARIITEQKLLEDMPRRSALDISTPAALVREMLDKLFETFEPTPASTFLDPACGRGTFLRELRKRLLNNEALIAAYPDVAERDLHIRTRMLHGFEIDLAMVNALQMQGYAGVQLQDALAYTGGNMKFDVVIGNPPYQDSSHKVSNHSLWAKFIALGIQLTNRYLSYVTPGSWISPTHKEGKALREHLVYADFEAKRYFPGIGSTFSWWIYDKLSPSILPPNQTLPKRPTTIGIQLYSKLLGRDNKFICLADTSSNHSTNSSRAIKTPDAAAIYRIRHTNSDYWYSARPSKDQLLPKVILCTSGSISPEYSADTGVSEHCNYYLVRNSDEGQVLSKLLTSTVYSFLLNQSRYGGLLHDVVLKNLPALDLTRSWTDQEIYEHFNLTPEEIAYVEATCK